MNKKIILGILISVALIYMSVRGINLQDVLNDLKKIQLSYVILFVLLMTFMQYLRSYRWGVILQPMEKIDQVSLFSITSVGFLAIAAIPARVGELARPYLISKRSSIKMSSALGTIIIERILDSLTVLGIASVVLLIDLPFDLPSWMIKSSIIFSLLALGLFCFILFLILRREAALRFINIILKRLPGKLANKIDAAIHHFIDGLQIVTNIKLFSYLLFLSVIIWLVDVLAIYVLLLAFGYTLPVLASFVVMVILIVGIAIPAAPGFVGNWHYACVFALGLFGLIKADALSFAVVHNFLSMAVVLVLGAGFLPFNRFSIADMKKQMNNSGEN
ncbi:MAG TPA: lysylphosphatidylglycerol synthase transmembrane domain-containing protein [Smithella sp.]|nr:lysylphosphatidylglycerol synthase transmembrane domain-containing protein [Smithella sp.]